MMNTKEENPKTKKLKQTKTYHISDDKREKKDPQKKEKTVLLT